MPIRLSGIASNLDTDAIIKELMSAQSLKKTKIENKITKHGWMQENWKSLNSKIYSLYTGTLSKMRMQGSYNTKKVASSNENALIATGTSTAPSGAHKIAINQLASAQYVTGDKIKIASDGDVKNITTLNALGIVSGSISIMGSDGVTPIKTLAVDNTKTVADFVTTCKDAGLNANFDEVQGRFFISSKESGESNSFSIASTDDTLTKLGLPKPGHCIEGDALAGTVNNSTTLNALGIADGSTFSIKGSDGSEIGSLTVGSNNTVGDFVAACKTAGLDATFDETTKQFYIKSGGSNSFSITSNDNANLTKLGLSSPTSSIDYLPSSQVTTAKDAEFTLNGATLTSSTNNVTVNGLSLELKEKTTSDITLTVTNDTNAVYDMVKGFLKEYNNLLGEMNDKYYAESARKYDPLTDEQKEEMTEDEIEKWEDKIKDSLLRRDDILSGLLSSMKTTLSKTVKLDSNADGTQESYSLSSFGISSVIYTEKGKLHIDGNSEDTLVADQPDKLRAALENNPDTVMKVLSELAGNLYTDMQDKMKSTTLSSALTFYNDKDMSKTLSNYQKELSTMEKKLQDIEDRYYKQFTAMEKAMSTLNSQSNSLSAMLSF